MREIRLTVKAYQRTLEYLGYAWETGKAAGWYGRRLADGGTGDSWNEGNAIGLYAVALEYFEECAL